MATTTTNSFYEMLRSELAMELNKLFELQGWYKPEVDLLALAKENADARRDEELTEGLAATRKAVKYFEDKKAEIAKAQIALRDLMMEYSRKRSVPYDAEQLWNDVIKFKSQKDVTSAIEDLKKIM